MNRLIIEIEEDDAGRRLDTVLAERTGISRNACQRLLEGGQVLLAGAPVKKNHRAESGARFEVMIPALEAAAPPPEDIALDIVYEDRHVIVINKARGMVVHPAPGNLTGTLVNALLFHCGDSLSGIGGVQRPGIVHRLDKDTSGLLIVAKDDAAHTSLSAQLKERTLKREYEAVVLGALKQDVGVIEAPVGRSAKDRKKMAVIENGREARTDYEVIARYNGYTRVRCRLHTGRTHQIRVHMAYIGHPVAGDPIYGARNDKSGLKGQCLHARRLAFTHPATGERIRLLTALPAYFIEIIKKLEKTHGSV